MSYKIFLNNQAIILTDNINENLTNIYAFSNVNLNEIIHKLLKNHISEIYLYHHNLLELWQKFKQHFDVIEAAGGIVENNNNEYLFILRNNRWDLPKGKMEANETPEETAIREVKEECGIDNIKIDHFLLDTYHLFTENKKKRLKITHWFKMELLKDGPISPQTEEGIEKVEWMDIKNNPFFLESSYENIKLLFSDLKKLKNIN